MENFYSNEILIVLMETMMENYKILKKSTTTNSATPITAATILPPFGFSFMYIEKNGNNHGPNVHVKFERTDIVQLSDITFH